MKKIVLVFASMLAFANSAFAFIGSDAVDLVYTPVSPCRLIDTRTSEGGTGPIASGGTKNFIVYGVTSYAFQGGNASDCGITAGSNVAAVAVNFTAVSPTGAGYLTAYPYGTTKPLAATLSYNTGEVTVSGFAVVKNSQTLLPSRISDLSIYSSTATEVVADIVGYYSKPVSLGSFVCEDTTPVTATINVTPFNSLYYGFATATACSAGYTQVALRCYTNNAVASAHEYVNGDCAANSPVNTHTLYASRRCCRIPGR